MLLSLVENVDRGEHRGALQLPAVQKLGFRGTRYLSWFFVGRQ
jgi:hypothetical protein